MLRFLICLFSILVTLISATALDFGLKFQSHSFPADQRTSLSVNETNFRFEKDFKIGFYFSFYSASMFGNIASVLTDDGQCVSVVASRLDDGTFYLGMVINDKLYHLKQPLTLTPEKPEHVELSLNKVRNTATLGFNDVEIEQPVNLANTSKVTFFFGMGQENKQAVVAPFELRNIRIFIDQRNTNHWDLKYHESDSTSIDDLGGVVATAVNPHWLIDEHADWQNIYAETITEKVQTAFDPSSETFYIVTDDKITSFSPISGEKYETKVASGRRVLSYSNHLIYDTVTKRLINYNLNRRVASYFDFDSKTWKNFSDSEANPNDEANYSNHAVAVDGNKLYTFGGYGFYKYHNDFFITDLTTGTIREQALSPELMPMTSSAATVVDGTLYIFGGKGNPSGRQELPMRHSYALYAYDTKTWKGEKVWELDSVTVNFIPSQSMHYDSADDCFYMAYTIGGGQLIRISRTKPELNEVSTKIESGMQYHDFVFDLYRSADCKRYYLLIDKRIDPLTHDYAIYTISTPFLDDKSIIDNKTPFHTAPKEDNPTSSSGWKWTLIPILIIIGALAIKLLTNRRLHLGGSKLRRTRPIPGAIPRRLSLKYPPVERTRLIRRNLTPNTLH